MAARCSVCDGKKTNPVHLRAVAGAAYHPYSDASKAGLKPISDGRAEYQASAAHQRAYEGARGPCAFFAAGAPTECQPGPITPHHTFPVGRAGNRERAERVAPVVPACAFHNTWVSQDPEGIAWGETHWITVGGRDWPFLMRDADARDLEAAGREYRPASVPSQAAHEGAGQ